jgi:PadR family transcriptional regulator
VYNTTTKGKPKMISNHQKEAQTKLTKGLLDMIVLQYLSQKSTHGYQLITQIRKDYGIYLGPSTVYPLLGELEKKGYLESTWDMNSDKPRKVYTLTNEGKNFLNFSENSLNLICNSMEKTNKIQIMANLKY